jgi:hypothetical protein
MDYQGGISYVNRQEPVCEMVRSLPFPAYHSVDSMLHKLAHLFAACRAQPHAGTLACGHQPDRAKPYTDTLADDHRPDYPRSEKLPAGIADRPFFIENPRSAGHSYQC